MKRAAAASYCQVICQLAFDICSVLDESNAERKPPATAVARTCIATSQTTNQALKHKRQVGKCVTSCCVVQKLAAHTHAHPSENPRACYIFVLGLI
jgi:hypothetical protein